MLTFVLLLQVATATPRATPVLPGPAATPRQVDANQGLSGAAKNIKIKRVDFTDVKTGEAPPPMPTSVPGAAASSAGSDLQRQLDQARWDYNWWVSNTVDGKCHPRAQQAAARANEISRQMGGGRIYPTSVRKRVNDASGNRMVCEESW